MNNAIKASVRIAVTPMIMKKIYIWTLKRVRVHYTSFISVCGRELLVAYCLSNFIIRCMRILARAAEEHVLKSSTTINEEYCILMLWKLFCLALLWKENCLTKEVLSTVYKLVFVCTRKYFCWLFYLPNITVVNALHSKCFHLRFGCTKTSK